MGWPWPPFEIPADVAKVWKRAGRRSQGVGTALYRALLHELETEPVHVALASIVLPNEPSVALHRKLGFTEVGTFHEYAVKNGQYLSSVWMERRL